MVSTFGEMAVIFITLQRREELPLSEWFMNCQMSYLPYWKVGRERYSKYLGRFGTILGHQRKKKRTKLEKIEESPTSLIDLPETRDLFTKEELEKLIPIAEQMWIESEGKLPDDYVSPLK